ncbi:MAG TPA: hypothetical protein PL134_06555, partial [Smithellaceae bacterium]|nr:hypothetical protein [Smithellaceae bacterium]HNT90932.1 hypothetical protein [Smithellaceae bacterium]HNV63605.1 hypothetical protein [Smithellaceae bacterium]HPG54037.1 hypothetical protein [Smithellaceae bacterium]HPL50717.1 hypothetical protein [Smithellaceae bacterium]
MKKIVFASCFFLLAGVFSAMAAETKNIGFIKNTSGQVLIGRAQEMIPAKVNDKLFPNDNLITGENGSVGVILQDNSVLSLGPKSKVNFSNFVFNPVEEKSSFVAKIRKGTVVYLTGLIAKLNPQAVRFETPTAV